MQSPQKVLIKGMVCQRCISTVKAELEGIGIALEEVQLGAITISATTQVNDLAILEQYLQPLGFNLVEDKRLRLVKEVKKLIAEVYSGYFDFPYRFRFSEFLSKSIDRDHEQISHVFAAVEKLTIEKYILNYRIEKAKELLVYTSGSLADISFKLGFSSVAHLSRQFKTLTGLNPSHFKSIRLHKEVESKEA